MLRTTIYKNSIFFQITPSKLTENYFLQLKISTVSIGTTAPGATLDVRGTYSGAVSNGVGTWNELNFTPTVDASGTAFGAVNRVATSSAVNMAGLNGAANQVYTQVGATGTITSANGGSNSVTHQSAGTILTASGMSATILNAGSAAVSTARGLVVAIGNSGSGSITNGYGVLINAPTNSGGGTFTNYYGLYLQAPTAALNNYSIYSGGGTNYFAGNVGIGTTSPNYTGNSGTTLSVASSAISGGNLELATLAADASGNHVGSVEYIVNTNTSAAGKRVAQIRARTVGTSPNNRGADLYFLTKGDGVGMTEKMRVTGDGYVGIGTTAPAYPLQVYNSSPGNAVIQGHASSGGAGYFIGKRAGATTGDTLARFEGRTAEMTDGSGAAMLMRATETPGTNLSSGAAIDFISRTNGAAAGAVRMTIDQTGNVGIGTTAPGLPFEVASFSATERAAKFSNTTAGSHTGVTINSLSGKDSYLALDSAGTSKWDMRYQASSGNFQIRSQTDNTTRFTIDTSGQVGIGTTTPAGRLEILSAGTSTSPLLLKNSSGNAMFEVDENAGGSTSVVVRNSAGAAKIALATAGDSYFVGGNVSIGTTSPTIVLDVQQNSASATTYPISKTSNTNATIGDGSTTLNYSSVRAEAGNGTVSGDILASYNSGGNFPTGVYVRSRLAHPLIFATNNVERARIDSSGNMGVGTSTPAVTFEVKGGNGYPAVSGTASTAISRIGGNPNNNILDIGKADATPWGMWFQATNRTDLSQTYPIILNPNGGAIGIGTTNPARPLHIYSNNNWPIRVENSTGTKNGILFLHSGTNGETDSGSIYQDSSLNMNFGSGGGTKMIITASGNVGIGTTAQRNRIFDIRCFKMRKIAFGLINV